MYVWIQDPPTTAGRQYQIVDLIGEFWSVVPENGTPAEATADYAAQSSDQSTVRQAVLWERQDGTVVSSQPSAIAFQMPGGALIPEEG